MSKRIMKKVNMVAGSGKTTTLLNVMKDNFEDKSILFLTFSKTAITDLENKLPSFNIPKGRIKFMTIDALAYRTLGEKYSFQSMGNYDQAVPLVSEKTGMKWNEVSSFSAMYINDLHERIEDELYVPKDKQDSYWDHFVEVYEDYGKYSFNYIMYKFREKINAFKDYLQYDLIMVDEAQDLSNIQIDIIRKIVEFNPNSDIHIVGDILQNIYGFRHAGASLLMESLGDDEIIETKGLTYRCPKMITDKANNLIDAYFDNFSIDKRFKVKLEPHKDIDGMFLFYEDKTKIKEFFPQKIQDMVENNKVLGVLVRNNYQLMDLVNLIPSQYQKYVYIKERNVFTGMPVLLFNQIVGLKKRIRMKTFTKKEVRSLCLTIGIFSYTKQQSLFELLRENKLEDIRSTEFGGLIRVLKSYSLNNFLNFKKEYIDYLRGLNSYIKAKDNNEAFITFLDNVDNEDTYRRKIEVISKMQNNFGKDKKIILMTVHASKGLEFDDVILYGMNYKIIEPDGEYKLLYVGVTRSKRNLYQFGVNDISRLIAE